MVNIFFHSIPKAPTSIIKCFILFFPFIFMYEFGIEIKLTTSTLAPTSTQTFTTTVRRIFISSTIAHTSTTTTEPSTEMDTTELYPGWNSVYYPGVESYQHHTNYINSQCSVYQRNFHLPLVSIVSLMLSLPLKIS